MSKNNENNSHVSEIALGSITADADVFGLYFPKKSILKSVLLVNGAGIAASDIDFVLLKLQNGTTDLASYDSRAAAQGALSANVPKAGAILSDEIPAGSYLKVNYDETGTIGLTNAKLIVEWFPL